MKKIDILTNDVLKFLIDKSETDHPDAGYAPDEIVKMSNLEYSEAQVYGALRRLLDSEQIVFFKVGRNKKYKYSKQVCSSSNKKSKSIDESEEEDLPLQQLQIPMDQSEYLKTLPMHMGNDVTEYGDQKIYIELRPLTENANRIIEKHGKYYRVLMMSIPPKSEKSLATTLFVESMHMTATYGKENQNKLRYCKWVEIGGKNWKDKGPLYRHREVFDYKQISEKIALKSV